MASSHEHRLQREGQHLLHDPSNIEQEAVSTAQFGESEYGQRLEYSKPVYRDVIFAILYYIHLAIVFVVAIYLWISQYPDITDSSWESDLSLIGIYITIIICIICAIIIGLFWLEIIKRFASIIIKTMLIINIASWIIVVILGVIIGDIELIIIGAIFALICCLWAWCIWGRIPFASALLSVSSSIITTYSGTIILSLMVIIFDILWILIWGSCFSAYLLVQPQPSGGVIFLFLLSFYWGFQVNQNIVHTTTCGVTASWYFSTVLNYNPTPKAFQRTMTTSFGSVCLGSLIVAVLQALRAIVQNSQNIKNDCLRCILLCILNCIETFVRWFNKYAYAQCAIYGTSFVTSAKRTWDLFATRGILALINDDLSGLVVLAGALVGGVVTAGIAYFVGYLFYNNNSDTNVRNDIPVALAVYGFFIGLLLCATILYVVHSSIICLFVCYAEDPAALQQNRPEEYNRITDTNPAFTAIWNRGDIENNGGRDGRGARGGRGGRGGR